MSDIDALAEVFEFRRTTAPPEYREQVETEGYDLIVYYVRTESSSSNSESLSLVQMADKRSLRMDLFAFVAFGEPDASRIS